MRLACSESRGHLEDHKSYEDRLVLVSKHTVCDQEVRAPSIRYKSKDIGATVSFS